MTDWLYRPADSLESHLAWTVLSSLDWAEGGLLSYDQHVTTAVTVVEAAMTHSCQGTYYKICETTIVILIGRLAYKLIDQSEISHYTCCRPPGPARLRPCDHDQHRQVDARAGPAEWAWEMVSRLHLHMMDRGGEEAQGAVNSDKDLLARLMDYDLDQRLQKVRR